MAFPLRPELLLQQHQNCTAHSYFFANGCIAYRWCQIWGNLLEYMLKFPSKTVL